MLLPSFVESANDPEAPFPLNNLPYGVCQRSTPADEPRTSVCVAIGDHVLDLAALSHNLPTIFAGPLVPPTTAASVFSQPSLNAFLALGRAAWTEVRAELTDALSAAPRNVALRDAPLDLRGAVLPRRSDLRMLLPAAIGDYTDFYSSLSHATNVGTMFRGPENALPPNWRHLPIAYHGRASSVILSGTPVHRPVAQTLAPGASAPAVVPSHRLDFELEMATLIGGPATVLGNRVALDEAHNHVFGFMLMNDWSARDIQKWEYVPLGPFTSKNFATTVAPWVVPLDALAPFAHPLPPQDPVPLAYLRPKSEDASSLAHCVFDVDLVVSLQTERCSKPSLICRSNLRNLYWSVAQQIAQHTVTGCNLRPGDLMASGTISGPEPASLGCMLELSWGGKNVINLENSEHGDTRTFLMDGDTVIMSGMARGDGYSIGFGECSGKILPAQTF